MQYCYFKYELQREVNSRGTDITMCSLMLTHVGECRDAWYYYRYWDQAANEEKEVLSFRTEQLALLAKLVLPGNFIYRVLDLK